MHQGSQSQLFGVQHLDWIGTARDGGEREKEKKKLRWIKVSCKTL